MKLFVSHSSKDIAIIHDFVELLCTIGLQEQDIFCSSIPEFSIPEGKDIYDYLAELFKADSLFVIFALSKNFYSSVVCQNEMGAAWVTKSDYSALLLPGFNYDEIQGVISNRKNYIKLDSFMAKKLLDDLKLKLQSLFQVNKPISTSRWERCRDAFLENALTNALIPIDISRSKTYCIGETISNGCKITSIGALDNSITISLDFSQTESDLCSFVVFPQDENWSFWAHNNYTLSFEAEAASPCETTLEIKRFETTYHVEANYRITAMLNRYELSLGIDKSGNWGKVIEVCFLFYKNDFPAPTTLKIKNIKISK